MVKNCHLENDHQKYIINQLVLGIVVFLKLTLHI